MYEYLLWLLPLAYAAHVLEEKQFNWKDWAGKLMGMQLGWDFFYLVNAAVIVTGFITASIGWRAPAISLLMPAQVLINAVFFHILPTLRHRVVSPGTLTAVLLFIPAVLAVYWGAAQDGVLTPANLLISVILGALVMAYPVILLKLTPRLAYPER
jgi:hypothetical protein